MNSKNVENKMTNATKLLYDETLVSFIDEKIVIVQLWMLENYFNSINKEENIKLYKQLSYEKKIELFIELKTEHLLYNDESDWNSMLREHELDYRLSYKAIEV